MVDQKEFGTSSVGDPPSRLPLGSWRAGESASTEPSCGRGTRATCLCNRPRLASGGCEEAGGLKMLFIPLLWYDLGGGNGLDRQDSAGPVVAVGATLRSSVETAVAMELGTFSAAGE